MRLSDVLSKAPKRDYTQVDAFLLNKLGNVGQKVDLSVGQVMLNYYCTHCEDLRTFYSKGKLSCIFINKHLISIDCVLVCGCGTNVQIWFLVESENDIRGCKKSIGLVQRWRGGYMTNLEQMIRKLCPGGVKFYPLDQVAHYAKKRIGASQIDETTYVSKKILRLKTEKESSNCAYESKVMLLLSIDICAKLKQLLEILYSY